MRIRRSGFTSPLKQLTRGPVRAVKKRLMSTYRNLKAARSELAELRKLVDTLPVGLHSLDRDGIITDINSTEVEMLGYTKQEMLGRRFTDFIPEEQQQEAWLRFQEKLRGNSVETITDRTYIRKDGSEISVASWDRVLRNEQGAVTGIVTVLINITELNQVHNQAAQTKKLQALGSMAAGVAHRFGNMFGAISMGAAIIEKKAPDNEHVEMIIDECERARGLIREVLDYTRRALFLSFETLNPSLVVEETLEDFEQELAEKGISLNQQDLAASTVKADREQIAQITRRLLRNSITAMPEGGQITVSLGEEILKTREATANSIYLGPGKYVVITIEDTGLGISPSIRKDVFDIFFTTDDDNHPGVGLAEVLAIAEALNGGVRLDNEIEQGTRISVYLPAVN